MDTSTQPTSTTSESNSRTTTQPSPGPHRVLSGIRATGRLHLGNYLGAVKGMLELQADPNFQTFYMVADGHAITTPYTVSELRENRRQVILDYLACGLDPEKSVIFQQAEVNEHFELAFYLSAVTTVAKMQHLPTFKDKVKQYPHNVNMALLNYPVLMAADILAYKAQLVPVGIDQEPHLEVTREIARRMNQDFGTTLPEPQRFATAGEYVPALSGQGKMSKSVEGSYINLTDTLEDIKKLLARVPTDSGQGKISEMSEGVKALLTFVSLFVGSERRQELEQAYAGSGLRYGELKQELAAAIFAELEPIQERRRHFQEQPALVDDIITQGTRQAKTVARAVVDEVKEAIGLG